LQFLGESDSCDYNRLAAGFTADKIQVILAGLLSGSPIDRLLSLEVSGTWVYANENNNNNTKTSLLHCAELTLLGSPPLLDTVVVRPLELLSATLWQKVHQVRFRQAAYIQPIVLDLNLLQKGSQLRYLDFGDSFIAPGQIIAHGYAGPVLLLRHNRTDVVRTGNIVQGPKQPTSFADEMYMWALAERPDVLQECIRVIRLTVDVFGDVLNKLCNAGFAMSLWAYLLALNEEKIAMPREPCTQLMMEKAGQGRFDLAAVLMAALGLVPSGADDSISGPPSATSLLRCFHSRISVRSGLPL
jgi:hypothetical protein